MMMKNNGAIAWNFSLVLTISTWCVHLRCNIQFITYWNSNHLARIPASRVGLAFEVQQEKLDFGMRLTRSMKQDKVMAHGDHSEEPTPAYSLLNAYASYDVNFVDSVGELFVKGYNLTDELA